MPQGTLMKRKPEHQNWNPKVIPRTGENHHTDRKKNLSKGSLTYTPRKRGEETHNGKTKTKPPKLRHKTIGSANLKRFSKKDHKNFGKPTRRGYTYHGKRGVEEPRKATEVAGRKLRSATTAMVGGDDETVSACVPARARERIERKGVAAVVGFWPNPKP